MRQNGFRWLLAGCLALAVLGCRPDPKPDSVLPEQTEWVARPDGFQERYALLPGASPRVELNVQFDAMDPVFAPQITKLSDAFVKKAQQEIRDRFGDLDRSAAAGYAMLEKVIDITHSPAYPDTTSFSQFPSSVSFKLNAEPAMSGGLKMACSVSDAL